MKTLWMSTLSEPAKSSDSSRSGPTSVEPCTDILPTVASETPLRQSSTIQSLSTSNPDSAPEAHRSSMSSHHGHVPASARDAQAPSLEDPATMPAASAPYIDTIGAQSTFQMPARTESWWSNPRSWPSQSVLLARDKMTPKIAYGLVTFIVTIFSTACAAYFAWRSYNLQLWASEHDYFDYCLEAMVRCTGSEL